MTRLDQMPPAQQAGILCNDPQFCAFVAKLRKMDMTQTVSPSFAAEHVRLECGVNSRADLNTNPTAAAKFAALRTEFDAWRGRIGRPE